MVLLDTGTPGTHRETDSDDANGEIQSRNPGTLAEKLNGYCCQGAEFIQLIHHYIFIIAQLWLTSPQRSTVVLLDTGTPGTSRETVSEDASGETPSRNC